MTRALDVDYAWVAGKRAANASWAAIARMAGCNEIDLRRVHDVGFMAPAVARREQPPRERVEAALRRAGLHGDFARIVARLWQANGARMLAGDLCKGVAGGAAACNMVRDARTASRKLGIGFEVKAGSGFALTPAGVVRVSEIAGLERGRP